MATVSDNFNRANGAPGSPWAALGTKTAPTIISNQLSGSASYALPCYTGVDVDLSIKLISTSSNLVNVQWGCSRYAYDDVEIWWGYYMMNNASGVCSINKRLPNSTPAAVASASGMGVPAANDVFRFTRVGNTLSWYKNAALMCSGAADNAGVPLADHGFIGLHNQSGTNVWDDFTATYTAASSAPATPTTLQLWPRGNLVR